MKLINYETGRRFQAVVEMVLAEDYGEISKSGDFIFDWKLEQENEVYKIRPQKSDEILGLMALIDIPEEYRIHIQLIESSKGNTGKNKKVGNIVGCLIASACRLAFLKSYGGFVSLIPKSVLINHYQEYYGFKQFGRQMAVEWEASHFLIKKYLDDEKI